MGWPRICRFLANRASMTSTVLMVAAWLTDMVVGDPEWAPHPVRWMGRAISAGDNAMNRVTQSTARAFIAGAVLTIVVVGTSAGAARLIVRATRAVSPMLGDTVEIALASTTLATLSLITEARSVLTAIRDGALDVARVRLARIVGRDTRSLEPDGMFRAVIETVAESTSDGIVAPLFYLAIGGLPAAMAYKAVNTLDSMIGHPEAPYQWFGKFSARLDDVAIERARSCRVARTPVRDAAAVTRHASRRRHRRAGRFSAPRCCRGDFHPDGDLHISWNQRPQC
jgi:adenosylcobinamide-phosphate synthase